MSTQRALALPDGVTITAGRETSQANSAGTIVQGMVLSIRLPSGTVTSVFVPYSQINDTAAVQALLDARVAAVMAITG